MDYIRRLILFYASLIVPKVVFTYTVTVTAGQATTPKLTFANNYPTALMDWGDGSAQSAVTSGVELNHTYANSGTYKVQLCMSQQQLWITEIDISSDKVVGGVTPIQKFENLTSFVGSTNAAWTQDISAWVLPASLVNFYVYSTSVSGDISAWVLPASLVNFYVYSTSVSGDISAWVLPASLVTFYVSSTSVSGDISAWVLPASLVTFYVYSTSVSGDISAWVLPASLVYFSVSSTSVSGCPILSSMVSIQYLLIQNIGLIQASVDLYLSRCVAREAATTYATPTLNLSGTNAAPSAAGLTDKATLVAAGWVVTTN